MRPNYKEIQEEISTMSYPQKEWKWIAYKEGNVYYYDTQEQAKFFDIVTYTGTGVTKLTERVQVNVEEYDQKVKLYLAEQQMIFDTWWNRVQEYFGEYSEAELDIMYDYAYEHGHAYGYDEVFSYMQDFTSIVDKFRKLYKEK